MPFDIKAAREAGASDEQIASYLEKEVPNFDVRGALKAGASLDQIGNEISNPSVKPKQPSFLDRVKQVWGEASKPLNTFGFDPVQNLTVAGNKLLDMSNRGAYEAGRIVAEDIGAKGYPVAGGILGGTIANAPDIALSLAGVNDVRVGVPGRTWGDFLSPKEAVSAVLHPKQYYSMRTRPDFNLGKKVIEGEKVPVSGKYGQTGDVGIPSYESTRETALENQRLTAKQQAPSIPKPEKPVIPEKPNIGEVVEKKSKELQDYLKTKKEATTEALQTKEQSVGYNRKGRERQTEIAQIEPKEMEDSLDEISRRMSRTTTGVNEYAPNDADLKRLADIKNATTPRLYDKPGLPNQRISKIRTRVDALLDKGYPEAAKTLESASGEYTSSLSDIENLPSKLQGTEEGLNTPEALLKTVQGRMKAASELGVEPTSSKILRKFEQEEGLQITPDIEDALMKDKAFRDAMEKQVEYEKELVKRQEVLKKYGEKQKGNVTAAKQKAYEDYDKFITQYNAEWAANKKKWLRNIGVAAGTVLLGAAKFSPLSRFLVNQKLRKQ